MWLLSLYSLSVALCILFGNFKVQCQCSENECDITDRSFPGVHELVTTQTPWYFYFLEGERVEWEFHTPGKSSGFKNQASGQSRVRAKMRRGLTLRPDTGDNMKMTGIFDH